MPSVQDECFKVTEGGASVELVQNEDGMTHSLRPN